MNLVPVIRLHCFCDKLCLFALTFYARFATESNRLSSRSLSSFLHAKTRHCLATTAMNPAPVSLHCFDDEDRSFTLALHSCDIPESNPKANEKSYNNRPVKWPQWARKEVKYAQPPTCFELCIYCFDVRL